MIKKLLKILVFSVIFLIYKKDIYAVEDARIITSFESSYEVNTENKAEVDVDITFTNDGNISSILSTYKLNIGNIDPQDIVVKYGTDEINYTVAESSGVIIQMDLGDIVLSPDTPVVIKLSYNVNKFFSEIGGSYDVTIPLFDNSTNTAGGLMTLEYPISFGEINYSNLEFTQETNDSYIKYTFESEEMESLFLSVGSRKNFSFNMERKLENTTDGYITQEILLPVDSVGQTVIFHNISPYPDGVNISDDGNLYINYNVPPSDTIWVRIQGIILSKTVEKGSYVLSSSEKAIHLDDSMALWKITDEKILKDVENVGKDLTLNEKIDWIYQYLMDNLNLNDEFRSFHSFEYRKGAELALKTYKNASAEDFADSFVALARLLDIPSRIVCGYVYPYSIGSNQAGMYHVWAQYWSEELDWVSIDPAYELYSGYDQLNGTGLNRVIMAIYPNSMVDVDLSETSSEIFYTEEDVEEIVDLDVEIDVEGEIQAGINETGYISLNNNGNTIIRNISFTDVGGDIEIAFGDKSDRKVLLPGESYDYSIRIKVSEWYLSGTKTIKIQVLSSTPEGDKRFSTEKRINVVPLRWAEPVTWIITSVLFMITTGILYYIYKFVSKKYPNILAKLRIR